MGNEQGNNRTVERWVAVAVFILSLISSLVQLNSRFDRIEFNQVLRDTVINSRFDKQYEINNQVRQKLEEHDRHLQRHDSEIEFLNRKLIK